jgi:CRISPR-associated exonuclease Cas4
MVDAEAVAQSEPVTKKVRRKIKAGIENYRAASDAPPKVDVYDVIEKVFSEMSPQRGEPEKVSVDEASGCLRLAYLERKEPVERTHKQMMATIMEKAALSALQKPENGEIDAGSNVKIVGRADRVEDDVVMVFKSVEKLPEMPFAEHFMQLNAFLYMFKKEEGVIIYFDHEGNEMEFIVPKSERLLSETARRARILNTLIKNNVLPALEPSVRCSECPYNEKCYYTNEDKQKWGFWARGKWRELKAKNSIF